MKTSRISKNHLVYLCLILCAFALFPHHAAAADVPYCSLPPFISGPTPNLLLMLDNSASQYDLEYYNTSTSAMFCYDNTYIDSKICTITKKTTCSQDSDCFSGEQCTNYCSVTKTQACTVDSNCPTGETCGGKFCSMTTSKSCSTDSDCPGEACVSNAFCTLTTAGACTVDNDCPSQGINAGCLSRYAGYFDSDTFYTSAGVAYSDDIKPSNTAFSQFTATSGLPASGCTFKTNYLCITTAGTTPDNVTQFVARGRFLNWLTASKMDVQKQILTGGKYDATNNVLIGESRGCTGQRFVKEIPDADWVTRPSGTPQPSITFGIRGDISADPKVPATGGATRIDIFKGNFDNADCQTAITQWLTNTSFGSTKGNLATCLNTSSSAGGGGAPPWNQALQTCWTCVSNPNTPCTVSGIGQGDVQRVQNSCTNLYGANDPPLIDFSDPNYICVKDSSIQPWPLCDSSGNCYNPHGGTWAPVGGYVGACYSKANGGWSSDAGNIGTNPSNSGCIQNELASFCNAFKVGDVVDPTSAGQNTSQYFNVPSMLLDAALSGQLGDPIRTYHVRVTPPRDSSNNIIVPTGVIQQFKGELRMGAMVFNKYGSLSECYRSGSNIVLKCTEAGNQDGGHIISYIGDPVGGHTWTQQQCDQATLPPGFGLVNAIDCIRAQTWTPFSEAFYNSIGYFANRSDLRLNTSDFELTKNPVQYTCQTNNVLIITDGQPTADLNSSVTGLVSTYHYDSQFDTVVNTSTTCPTVKYAGSRNLDDLAWLANTKKISDFTKTPAANKDRISTYVVYSGVDTGGADQCNPAKLMQDTANRGGGKYLAANTPSQLTQALTTMFGTIADKAASGSAVSVLTTSARGVGSMLQAYFKPTKYDNGKAIQWLGYTQNLWIDPQDNLRDDYSGNGTPDHHLILNQDNVVKLYYDPSTSSTWAALFTTDADGNNGTLAQCSSSSYTITPFESIVPLWEGGSQLANVTASSDGNGSERTIFTAIPGGAGMNTVGGVPFTVSSVTGNATLNAALNSDTTYSSSDIVKYVRGVALEDPTINATGYTNFRDRRLTIGGTKKVWKLGDVINSTPKVVANLPQNTYLIDYGDRSYYDFISSDTVRNRTSIAVIGANDGMLHAFRVGYLQDSNFSITDLGMNVKAKFWDDFGKNGNGNLGKEVWAYIPYNAMPYLKYLADPNYCHVYFVDLSVKLYDASVNGAAGAAKTASSWKTILIGGMRFGGACSNGTDPTGPPISGSTAGLSSYFALDITDVMNPVPLWEFTDADLGYTTSSPAVIRTGDPGVNGNWYVVLGSGSTQLAKPSQDIARNRTGYIYILNLSTGALVKKIGLGHNAIVSDILSIDADKDYHSEKIYFGTSYCTAYDAGNNCLTGSWNGKIMSLTIPLESNGGLPSLCGTGVSRGYADCTPASNSPLITLFDGGYPFTASPDATKDSVGNLWVYAGSGKYFSGLDESDTSPQVFLGIKDLGKQVSASASASCPSTCTSATQLCDVSNCRTTATVPTTGSTVQACVFDKASTSFKIETIVTAVTNASTVPESPIGWVIYLNTTGAAGERVISRPLVAGGVVDFLSYVPSNDICSHGGESYLYALDYLTGVAPSNMAIRAYGSTVDQTDHTTIKTAGNVEVARRVDIGAGAPPTGEAIIITPPKEGEEKLKKKIQVSTGVIVETENKPILSTVSNIIHWLKK